MPSLRPSLHVVFATIAGLKLWNANTTVGALDESATWPWHSYGVQAPRLGHWSKLL